MKTQERPTISAEDLKRRLQQGSCEVVDVREGVEWQQGHVPGGRHLPLGDLGERCGELPMANPLVVMCASGKRSEKGAALLRERGFGEVMELEGGMTAWESAGHEVARPESAPWPLERQVRFTAGLLVLLGLVGGQFWPAAIFLSWFVAAGLVFAAVIDWCGMGLLLAKAPWNRVKGPEPEASGSCSWSGNGGRG